MHRRAQPREPARQCSDLDDDAPWKSVVPYPVNLSEGWARTRIDWWALEFAVDGKSRKSAAILLALFVTLTLSTGRWLLSDARRDQERARQTRRRRLAIRAGRR